LSTFALRPAFRAWRFGWSCLFLLLFLCHLVSSFQQFQKLVSIRPEKAQPAVACVPELAPVPVQVLPPDDADAAPRASHAFRSASSALQILSKRIVMYLMTNPAHASGAPVP